MHFHLPRHYRQRQSFLRPYLEALPDGVLHVHLRFFSRPPLTDTPGDRRTVGDEHAILVLAPILAATRPGWVGPSSKGGTAVLVGVPAEREMTINPMLVMPFQRTYTGHGASDADRDFPMFLRLYAEGKFPLDKLVTDRYRLEQINEACDALRAGDVMGRAILEY